MTLGMPGGQGKAHFDSGEGQRATRGSVQHLMHQISAGVFCTSQAVRACNLFDLHSFSLGGRGVSKVSM